MTYILFFLQSGGEMIFSVTSSDEYHDGTHTWSWIDQFYRFVIFRVICIYNSENWENENQHEEEDTTFTTWLIQKMSFIWDILIYHFLWLKSSLIAS